MPPDPGYTLLPRLAVAALFVAACGWFAGYAFRMPMTHASIPRTVIAVLGICAPWGAIPFVAGASDCSGGIALVALFAAGVSCYLGYEAAGHAREATAWLYRPLSLALAMGSAVPLVALGSAVTTYMCWASAAGR